MSMKCDCDPLCPIRRKFCFISVEEKFLGLLPQPSLDGSVITILLFFWSTNIGGLSLPFNELVIHFYLSDMNWEGITNSCIDDVHTSYQNIYSRTWRADLSRLSRYFLLRSGLLQGLDWWNEKYKLVTYKTISMNLGGSYLSLFLFSSYKEPDAGSFSRHCDQVWKICFSIF